MQILNYSEKYFLACEILQKTKCLNYNMLNYIYNNCVSANHDIVKSDTYKQKNFPDLSKKILYKK